MLFHSTIRRELARSFGATLVVMFTIAMTLLLVRTLNMANRGKVNPEEIMLMLTYTVVAQLPMVLTITLFIAVVSTFSRMYRESEMAIWFSSGQGLAHFVRPVVRFAWPVWLAIVLLALFAWPWAKQESVKLSDRYERRGDLERVTPGQFQESANGQRVFFIDKDSEQGKEGHNVFISNNEQPDHHTTISAQRGRVEWVNNEQMLILNNGQMLESIDKGEQSSLRVSEFAEYRVQIGQAKAWNDDAGGVKAMSTWRLLQENDVTSLGELGWRLGQLFTAMNFVLVALAVTGGSARSGRSANLAFILLAFVAYTNIGIVGQSWITAGKAHWLGFPAVLHGGVFLLSTGWLFKRHYNLTLRPKHLLAPGASA